MVYGFARQSGGQTRIYSEEGKGTMVCLYLPRCAEASQEAVKEEQTVESEHTKLGEIVLVVDDEQTVRMLVTDVLEELGYVAVEAAEGKAGLQILESKRQIDLLITDVGLPGGMNGRQLADAGTALRPNLKVLFITGYAENAVIGDGHLRPGMHVLTKPFSMDALANRITTILHSV
jgi:CheY-like chemotaxis protein